MTSLLEGARKLVTRGGSDLGARLEALEAATTAARGRLDDEVWSTRPTTWSSAPPAGCGSPPTTRSSRSRARPARASPRRSTRSPASSCPPSAYAGPRRRGPRRACGAPRAPASCWSGSGIPPRHQTTRDSMLDPPERSRGPTASSRASSCSTCPTTTPPRSPTTSRSTARQARRPAGLGARPAEVRRRRDPRPLPRAAALRTPGVMVVVLNHIDTVARATAATRCSPTCAGCSTHDGLPRCRSIATSARHGDGIAELRARDRAAGGRQGLHPAAARGRPARGRRPASRPAAAASPARSPPVSGRRRPRTRWPTPPACPTVVAAIERSTRTAGRARPPAGRSSPGSRGCAPTRSSGSTSTSARRASSSPRATRTSMPEATPGPARPRRQRGACARRRRLRRHDPARGPSRAPRLGLPAARRRRPPRHRRRRDRPRRRLGCPCGPASSGCSSGCCSWPRSPARCGPRALVVLRLARRRLVPDVAGIDLPILLLRRRGRARDPARPAVPGAGRPHRAPPRGSADRRLREAVHRGLPGAGGGPGRRRAARRSAPCAPTSTRCSPSPSTPGDRGGLRDGRCATSSTTGWCVQAATSSSVGWLDGIRTKRLVPRARSWPTERAVTRASSRRVSPSCS